MRQVANGIMVEHGSFRVVRRQRRVRDEPGRRPVAGRSVVELAGIAGGIVELSAAERGLPMDPMPWSFWLVLRLGEAMLAAGALGVGWMLLWLVGSGAGIS